jgi:hypothetical protein
VIVSQNIKGSQILTPWILPGPIFGTFFERSVLGKQKISKEQFFLSKERSFLSNELHIFRTLTLVNSYVKILANSICLEIIFTCKHDFHFLMKC